MTDTTTFPISTSTTTGTDAETGRRWAEFRVLANGNYIGQAIEITAGGCWASFGHGDRPAGTFTTKTDASLKLAADYAAMMATRPF